MEMLVQDFLCFQIQCNIKLFIEFSVIKIFLILFLWNLNKKCFNHYLCHIGRLRILWMMFLNKFLSRSDDESHFQENWEEAQYVDLPLNVFSIDVLTQKHNWTCQNKNFPAFQFSSLYIEWWRETCLIW